MTRPIRFRAWHEGQKKWLHDSKSSCGGCNILGETIWAFGQWCPVPVEELNDVMVEQFTGLTDKNGVEIYEGDVVRCEIYGYLHWGEVEYDAPHFKAEDKIRFAEAGNSVWIPLCVHVPVEVIGNIHDNPELLKP